MTLWKLLQQSPIKKGLRVNLQTHLSDVKSYFQEDYIFNMSIFSHDIMIVYLYAVIPYCVTHASYMTHASTCVKQREVKIWSRKTCLRKITTCLKYIVSIERPIRNEYYVIWEMTKYNTWRNMSVTFWSLTLWRRVNVLSMSI